MKGYVLGPGEGLVTGESGLKAPRTSTGGSLALIESHTTGGARDPLTIPIIRDRTRCGS